jgi:autophagy-related protein 13
LPIRKPSIFKANTVSSTSGSSPSLSIRQAMPSSLSREGVGPTSGVLAGTGGTHSRQSSYSSPIINVARLPPSPIGTGFSGTHTTTTSTPSSFGDKRSDTSGGGADSERDRRISMNSVGFGPTSTEEGSREVGPMSMPPRKRYSSSFGHRYPGSGGSSAGTGMVVGSAASGGIVMTTSGAGRSSQSPASGRTSAVPSGRNTPASASEGKKEVSTISNCLLCQWECCGLTLSTLPCSNYSLPFPILWLIFNIFSSGVIVICQHDNRR